MPPSSPPSAADLHALRDREEAERLRHLGALVSHDLNNALFALAGRAELLRRRVASEPDSATRAACDELLAAVRLLERQLGQLQSACAIERSAHERAASTKGSPAPSARTVLSQALARSLAALPGVAATPIDDAIATIPTDCAFAGTPADATTAIEQLVSLHRSRRPTSLTIGAALVGTPDAPRLAIAFEDDAGDWPHPLTSPSLLADAFDLACMPLAAAGRAARECGGRATLARTPSGLRSEFSFGVRRGIALAPSSMDQCSHARPTPRPPRRVLVADDDPAVRAVVVAALESVGDDVDAIEIPSAVATIADLSSFDVIVLDAGGGGTEALAAMRARGERIPVLLVSGDLLDRPADDPATEVLVKPFALGALDAALERARDVDRRGKTPDAR